VFDRVFAQVFGGIVDPADQRGETSAPPPAHVRPGEQRPPTAGDRAGAISPVPSPNPVGDPGR
jgi:uncharacterized protein